MAAVAAAIPITKQDCDKWLADPQINPITNRKIIKDGPTYKKLHKECIPIEDRPIAITDCEKWKKNPTHHPITNRKLNVVAKTGIYQQLLKLCDSKIPVGRPKSIKSIIINDNLEAKRNKLIDAIKKTIAPILHKGDNTEMRLQFAKIMTKYLIDIKPCLEKIDDKLCLLNKKNKNIIIYFDKRIGSESKYGVAYLNIGKGFAKLLKFSCKIMSSKIKGHKQEIELLEKMSNLVEKGISPNMPVVYKSLKCKKKCDIDLCPKTSKQNGYYLVVNELANYDIQTWFIEKHSRDVYESVLIQLLFAIYSFHGLGFYHNDCHLANFLIHKIKPGGCWRYQINNKNIYVPNCGYLLVMWDPGMAEQLTDGFFVIDYVRAFQLILKIDSHKTYIAKGLKPLPNDLLDYGVVPLINSFNFSSKNEQETMIDIIDRIDKQIIKFKSISVDGIPPTYLLNIKPYKMV